MTTAAKELKPFCVEVFALWYHEDHSSDRHFSRTYTIYTLCLVFGGIFYAQTILCSSLTALSNNFIHSWYARCFITMCNKRDFLFKHTRDILTIIHRSYALIILGYIKCLKLAPIISIYYCIHNVTPRYSSSISNRSSTLLFAGYIYFMH